MSDECRKSALISIFKNKKDMQNYAIYKGVKFMSHHSIKLWKKMIERNIRKETQVTDNQFGFMSGRSTMKVVIL